MVFRLGVVLLAWFCSIPVAAHHSRSAFALNESVTVRGQVTEVGWTNPHYYLVVNDPRNGLEWTFEGHSIPGLVRSGWSRETLRVGEWVSVVASPNKQANLHFGLLKNVTKAGGETYYSFKPPRKEDGLQVNPSTDFTGTWRLIRSLRDNLLSPDGPPAWPYSERGASQVGKYNPSLDPSISCRPRGVPRMLEWPYAQQWRLTDQGMVVSIEHAVEERLFNFAAPASLQEDRLGLGVSVVLEQSPNRMVVTTSGFRDKAWGLVRGIDSSVSKHLTETYELIEDGLKMKLTYTVVDTAYLTQPAETTFYFAKVADYVFAEEPACDITTAQRHLKYE
jgi:hypothetical protein